MKYTTEIEVMTALGIESWRNLSRDKMIQFASMMPDMDQEVALKVIEQFPEFSKFALELLDGMEKRHESTLNHNQQSQQSVHLAYKEIREVLEGELNKSDLSWDQRKYLIDKIMETGDREYAKDSENKQLLEGLFREAVTMGAISVLTAAVIVGGRAILKGGSNTAPPPTIGDGRRT